MEHEGVYDATKLIYIEFRSWMRARLGRSVDWRGTPLRPGFEWVSNQYFEGRSMVDVAQELEGEALEGAGRGIETHQPDKGPLIPWIRKIMRQHLNAEIERWVDVSSSVSEDREPHESLDTLLGLGDSDEDLSRLSRRQKRERSRLVDAAIVAADPADEVESDPVDREMCDVALEVLSAMEREALLRFSEGESYKSIARNLSLSGATSAHRIVDRARLKAQEALS